MASTTPAAQPTTITPVVALQLRLRWLEALINGLRPPLISASSTNQQTISRRAGDIHGQLDTIVKSNDAIRQFLDKWDLYAHLLTPAFALSPGNGDAMLENSVGAFDALLADMETDIRQADSALREIATLETAGATGAGKLAQHEELQPRLRALIQAHEDDMEAASRLERRVAELLRRYAVEIDTLSELFVSWNATVNEVEDRVAALEREKVEKQRLGLIR